MILLSSISGIITGAFILGIIGRFVTTIVSVSMGKNLNLSFSGIIEALAIGSVAGLCGGILNCGIRRIDQLNRFVQSILLSLVMFAVSVLVSVQFIKMEIDFSCNQFFILFIIYCVYVGYGFSVNMVTDWIVQLREKMKNG